MRFKKFITLAFEICWTAQFAVSFGFWGILFPYIMSNHTDQKIITKDVMSILGNSVVHLVPFLFIIFEHCLCHFQMVLRHIFICYLLIIIWAIVDSSITLNGYDPSYPMITWRDWETMGFAIAFFLLYGVGFLIAFWFSKKKNKNSNSDNEERLALQI